MPYAFRMSLSVTAALQFLDFDTSYDGQHFELIHAHTFKRQIDSLVGVKLGKITESTISESSLFLPSVNSRSKLARLSTPTAPR
jgi:hypothetical protein